MELSLPSRPAALVSCHVERPLDERSWAAVERLLRRRPGGFPIAVLMRPPADGEDQSLWLERSRTAAALGPFGHHTHWTSPTHARPTGGDPAAQVREEGRWLRERGLSPTLFCGGGWYMDARVAKAVAELGYADCTARAGGPCRVGLPDGALLPELPTTHSLGALARGVCGRLATWVHAYFHDYDLVEPRRRLALAVALFLLARRRPPGAWEASGPVLDFSEVFAR
jgi:hypothetical protein